MESSFERICNELLDLREDVPMEVEVELGLLGTDDL